MTFLSTTVWCWTDIASKCGDQYVTVEAILMALFEVKSAASSILKDAGMTGSDLKAAIRMKKHAIGWDDVRHIIVKDDAVLLMLAGGKRYTCLMLPASVVDPDVAQLLRKFAAHAH